MVTESQVTPHFQKDLKLLYHFLGADRVFGTAITNSEIEQVLRDKRSATYAFRVDFFKYVFSNVIQV